MARTYFKRQINIFFKKNPAHAYFEAPYFSKFFGGKIESFLNRDYLRKHTFSLKINLQSQ